MQKIFRSSIIVLFSFLVLVFPNYSIAELQSFGDPDYGEGAITYDTETGLEWLDLTYTANMSYDEVSVQIDHGGEFVGFRRPTQDEVFDLYLSAGMTLDPYGHFWYADDPESMDMCTQFIEILGATMWQWGYPGFRATYGEPIDAGPQYLVRVGGLYVIGLSGNPYYWARVHDGVYATFIKYPTLAHFLVRTLSPVDRLTRLQEELSGCVQSNGILVSLEAKLSAASQALDDLNENNDGAAINKLQAFINAVEAQWGKHIPEADAEALIATAQGIIDTLSSQ